MAMKETSVAWKREGKQKRKGKQESWKGNESIEKKSESEACVRRMWMEVIWSRKASIQE